MTERLRESLSALMDDAADDLELARVLRAMDEDDDVSATWSRYHLVSAVLNGSDVDAHASIARLDLELEGDAPTDKGQMASTPEAGDTLADVRTMPAWMSFAAAASVTLALVVGFQWQTGGAEAPVVASSVVDGPVLTDRRALLNASEGGVVQGPSSGPLVMPSRFGSAPNRASGDAQRQVDAYMLYHAEFTAVNSASGIMPFARYAAFQGGR